MGMDLMGVDPKNDKGTYFRNNVWWWHPLAEYITSTFPDLAANCEHWHSNDGDGLNEEDSIELAKQIRAAAENGSLDKYINERQAKLDAMPDLKCDLCQGTGVRTDRIGVENGMPNKLIEEEGHPRNGEKGYCNGCGGKGTNRPFECKYHISKENTLEFAEFIENSGGFRIH